MKILMVLMGLDIGGAETHVVELSKELARRDNDIVVASNGGVFTAELEEAGIRHICLPLNSRNIRKMAVSYLGLKKLLKSEEFDLVHAHARIPAFICGLLHRKLKFRFITSAHWVFKTGPILNLMTNWGERTIAVSEDIKSYLVQNYGVVQNHITVTINGIDTEKFSPDTKVGSIAEEFNLTEDRTRAVYVSRMDKDRSAVAINLIEITPMLYEKYPDFELVIVGGGNDFDRISAEAEKCNNLLGKRVVIVTGGRCDINKFVSASDVFIGVSRAALEAMSAAKPVVIAGNEGYIGLFEEDKLETSIETNFCCRGCAMPKNSVLYKDIERVFDMTSEKRREMGEYNRRVVLELYAGKRMADDCERAYADLLSIDRRRPNDIMISGYYGYKNSGDDSLLYAIINNLTEIKPNVDITVLSIKPSETVKLYGVKSIHRFNVFKILRAMRRTKLLISGGGSLVQDVTSTQSLIYYLSVIKSAKKCGMKVMVYASGIGPIRSGRNRRLSGKVLNAVDLITLREPDSFNELKLLGVEKPPVYITTDPAFSLGMADNKIVDKILQKEGIEPNREYFIVSVRPWKRADSDFYEKISRLCDYISKKYGMTALFVPMQQSVDIAANQQIACGMETEYKTLSGLYSVNELLGIIARTKLVIGMRLHVLIYAATACVPVFGLSYDPKVDSMLSYLCQNYKENVEGASLDSMIKSIDEIMGSYDEVKTCLIKETDNMKERTKNDSRFAADLLKSNN